MKPRPIRPALLVALATVAALAPARADESERARIGRERAEVEQRYAERERACRERFVVTSCVEDAKRDRRRDLDALRARQLRVDEETRHQRTEARRAELAAKAAEDARHEQERAARGASAASGARSAKPLEPRRAASEVARSGREPRDRPLTAGERLGIQPTRRDSDAERREREEKSRAAYEERQRQAAEHRREAEEKAAKRLREHPAAVPLPVPGAATPR